MNLDLHAELETLDLAYRELWFLILFPRFTNLPSVLYSLKSLEIILASGNQVRTGNFYWTG